MPHITVDGVDYIPADSRRGGDRVGIAITSRNRHQVLAETLEAFAAFTPASFPIVVVDDGSDVPVKAGAPVTVVRHDSARGIPAAKNRCIAELMALGVDHLFLFDDDTRPQADGWWRPYVDSAEPHLQFSWTQDHRNKPVPRMDVLYRDDRLVAYGWSMGCMLYLTAGVVDRVGGMRPEFGLGMDEHGEYSQRIHNAGLTTFVHQDVPDSDVLFWAADRLGAISRSIPAAERAKLLERNERLRLSLLDDDSFVPFAGRDCVVASYFTSTVDVQRGRSMPVDTSLLKPLMDSLAGQDFVLLTDITAEVAGCEVVRLSAPLPAYQQRWISQWQWLRDHPEVRFVWLVDATDVRMLNAPWPLMRPGVLYCGWELETVGCDWMRQHSPNTGGWVDDHASDMLLNAGVVGGDRLTVMRLCRDMIGLWLAGDKSDPCEEMAFLNIAARRHDRLVSGIQVATVFKSNTRSHPTAWFAHK